MDIETSKIEVFVTECVFDKHDVDAFESMGIDLKKQLESLLILTISETEKRVYRLKPGLTND